MTSDCFCHRFSRADAAAFDEFLGVNEGLNVAEIELKSEDQAFDKPDWVGEEVTGDPKYYNSNLIANPYKNW